MDFSDKEIDDAIEKELSKNDDQNKSIVTEKNINVSSNTTLSNNNTLDNLSNIELEIKSSTDLFYYLVLMNPIA